MKIRLKILKKEAKGDYEDIRIKVPCELPRTLQAELRRRGGTERLQKVKFTF